MGRGSRAMVGVALAGGHGRRIGGSKARVELSGRPLLHYPLAALAEELDEVAVVAKRDSELPDLPHGVSLWLEDDEPRHPLAGVLRALRCADGRPVVVIACDMPLVTARLVGALRDADAAGAPAVVAASARGIEPLCARYEPAALALLEGFDTCAPARAVVAALDPLRLHVDDEQALLNVNVPEDLLIAAALLR